MEDNTIMITITYKAGATTGNVNVSYDDDYVDEIPSDDVAQILEAAAADIREQSK